MPGYEQTLHDNETWQLSGPDWLVLSKSSLPSPAGCGGPELGRFRQVVSLGPSPVGGSGSPRVGSKVTSMSSKPLLRWASAWSA